MNKGTSAYVFDCNQEIKCNMKNSIVLITALATGKRIKLQLLQGGTKNQFIIGTDFFSIESLSIIAN